MRISENSGMKIYGLVLFAGVAQFFIFVLIAEAIYPNYSVANNYIRTPLLTRMQHNMSMCHLSPSYIWRILLQLEDIKDIFVQLV